MIGKINFLDCTFRDGGYYNAWDFERDLVDRYLQAMAAAGVDIVELGFRFIDTVGFRGACAYTTDEYIRQLTVPGRLKVAVMVNASDLVNATSLDEALNLLFPNTKADSPVSLVRIACHAHEVEAVLPATTWLIERGFAVGLNIMQIADRSQQEVMALSAEVARFPVDVLYFADSMGSMDPDQVIEIIRWIREAWTGPVGIHTHDNMGLGLQNTLCALDNGASWADSTVTGMGRGPGNTRTEELAIELDERRDTGANLIPLLALVRNDFAPMKKRYGWGTNPYYFLAGKYGIHPTYVQKMLSDSRYDDEDLIAVLQHLRTEGGKKYSAGQLLSARQTLDASPSGSWSPADLIAGREVLILGTGPGAARHREALEAYVREHKPIVMALNTQEAIAGELTDFRLACHPVRLVADYEKHAEYAQPLIAPLQMLPEHVKSGLNGKTVYDFGLAIDSDTFEVFKTHCVVPAPLVAAYALAVAASGGAKRILLAGFDGFPAGDMRNDEMLNVLERFVEVEAHPEVTAITPTNYGAVETQSIYGLMR